MVVQGTQEDTLLIDNIKKRPRRAHFKSICCTGDFCQLVHEDIQLLDLQESEGSISRISKYYMKVLVKTQAKKEAFKYLISIKENKSKMDNIW